MLLPSTDDAFPPAEPLVRRSNDTLARLAGGIFVGRERELAALRSAWQDALAGRGRLVLLVGEPGIGKSRTAEELATEAHQRQAQVLIGRCFESAGAPAYWPWVQMIRTYVESQDPAVLIADLGPYASDIAQIVPALRERFPDLPAPPTLEPEQARFRLFDSVTLSLRRAAARQPLVLIVDDLHWADKASVLLLAFLAQALGDTRILVVGTYRDVELEPQHPFAEALGQLVAQQRVSRLWLRGLDEEEVARFIAVTAGMTPSPALVAAVHRETEGNPLFVTEVVRLLETEGRLAHHEDTFSGKIVLPQAVREVIGRRLSRLSPQCLHMLTLAAVVGREFALNVMELVSGLSQPELLVVLDEAAVMHVLTPVDRAVGRYRFSHALIRETLYEGLSPARQVEFHRQIGEALEALSGGSADRHLDALAHHFFQSAAGGDVERAVDYSVRAARRAVTLLAYEEAAGHYERALQALDLTIAAADADRSRELMLALGEAHAKAGDTPRAKATFLRAVDLARSAGASEQFARAVLGFAGSLWTLGVADQGTIGLLEEALVALPEGDSVLRARVLGRLAMELCYAPQSWQRRTSLTEQAVGMARRIGCVETLAYALTARRDSLWSGDHIAERLADADELLRLAEESGNAEAAIEAHFWRARDLLELGDAFSAEAEIAEFARLARDLRHALYLARATVYRGTWALVEGRYDDALRLAAQALAEGRRAGEQNIQMAFAAQLAAVHRARGPLVDIEPGLHDLAERYPGLPCWRAALAAVYAEDGRSGDARREFERLARKEFADLPQNYFRLLTAVLLGETCAWLGDTERAAQLYAILLPHADRNVLVPVMVDCWGSVSRVLGLLATTMGRDEDAARHFDDALAMNARLGARPYVARTQHAYAEMLFARDRPGDRVQARTLLTEALETARELGMAVLVEKALGLVRALDERSPEGEPSARPSVFRQDGDSWIIGGGAGVFRLKGSIGLRCLAELLHHPGGEFLALELITVARGVGERMRAAVGDTGPLLDPAAKAAYRERLRDLRAELENAAASQDADGSARIQAEIDFLGQELAHAVGLTGRDRRCPSACERARINVTRALRRAVRSIAAHDAALGDHLTASVKTGMFCSYQPVSHPPVSRAF